MTLCWPRGGVARATRSGRESLFSHRDHNPPPPHRMLHQFVRPCDLGKWNALSNLEPGPPRLKRIVQIPRRGNLGLCRKIIAPKKNTRMFLNTISQNGILGVAVSVA